MVENVVFKQRDYMRNLVRDLGPDPEAVCRAYAQAERDGLVKRTRNEHGLSPEDYAVALWKDGTGAKGWLDADGG